MAAIKNPQFIIFDHPTTRTDGAPLADLPLNYELGIRKDGEELKPLLAVVGSLQDNGHYKAPIALSDLDKGVSYFVALRAIDPQDVASADDDLYSAWSNEVEIVFTVAAPSAPTNFSVG